MGNLCGCVHSGGETRFHEKAVRQSVRVLLDEFGLVGDQFAPQFIGQAARFKPRQGFRCRLEDSRPPRPGRRQIGFAAIVDLRTTLRKFGDDFAGQCLINGRAAVATRCRTVHRLGFGKHEAIERQVSVAIADELKIDWSSHDTYSRPGDTARHRAPHLRHPTLYAARLGQPCIMRSNAAISIVAKFEKVSEMAYGKTIRSLCRIPPQV
jgi:hypothetical protein